MIRSIANLTDAFLEFHLPVVKNRETGLVCKVAYVTDEFVMMDRNGVTFPVARRDENYVGEF